MYVIREKFFRLGEDSDIFDDHGGLVLHVDGKMMSLHNRLVLRDPQGQEVAQVYRKLVSLRTTYQISIGGEPAAQVRKHFFTPFVDRFTIDIPGPDDLEMSGDCSTTSSPFAAVSRPWPRCRSSGRAARQSRLQIAEFPALRGRNSRGANKTTDELPSSGVPASIPDLLN